MLISAYTIQNEYKYFKSPPLTRQQNVKLNDELCVRVYVNFALHIISH